MSLIILNVDEVRRTLSASGGAFVTHDKEVDIVRFAINSGFADIVLDGQVALRVMYQRPGESQVRAQTLTYYDTDGLRSYYDWHLLPSDLAEKGTLTVALCILRTDGDVEEWHTTPCQIRVLDTIHTDDSDEGDESITPTVAQRVAVLETMIQRVASGAPRVVASTSAMTDTDQIYVLSTDDMWYYYDGSAWVAGGEYGAVATDTTLTQPGVPADAKKTGDEITTIKADLDSFKVSMILDLSDIRNAYQSGTAGNVVSFISATATKTIVHAISVRSGQTYTINARYGSAVSSANTRACMCVDDSDVVIQQVPLQVTANSTNTATFKALQDGFLNVSVDSKYESIEIIGFDPNAPATIQKSANANSEIIAEIKTEVQDTKVKAKLISCLRNMGWSVANGYYYLLAFCEAIGINGWVDVKPKTSINSTTGNTRDNDEVWRQASYFINVDSYTSIKSDFADNDNYGPYYVVRCYNSEKEYIGTAEMSDGSVGISIGTAERFFPQNTSYIRLLLAPNSPSDSNLDLTGVYTGRVLELTLTDSNQATTKRKYALVEVEDFSDV